MDPILELIAQNRLEEALDRLYNAVPNTYKSQVILLRNKLGELERKVIVGTLTHGEESVERSKIIDAMLKLHANAVQIAQTSDSVSLPREIDTSVQQIPTSRIYFSYSWKDAPQDEQNKVNQLYNSLSAKGYCVLLDKTEVKYGESISSYMEELGRGDLIVAFLSESYMKSPYCMFELIEIGRNATWDKNIFSNKILPIPLEEIRFDHPHTLARYFRYWKQQQSAWSELIQEWGDEISPGQSKRFDMTKKIRQQFGEVADWLSDINTSTTELLAQNDFEKVEQAIENRLTLLRQ